MVKSVIQLIFLALAYTRAGDQSSSLPSHHLNDSVLITAELVEGGPQMEQNSRTKSLSAQGFELSIDSPAR